MQWDADIFEQEVRSCLYFQQQGFSFTGRKINEPGTERERHEVILDNTLTDRSLEVTFAPPSADGRPAVSQVYVVKTSTDDDFNLKDYIKQYHGVDFGPKGSRYTDYSGSFQERVRAYLEFATGLLSKYAEPTLQGLEWPDVEFDWAGYK
jgi:hypothetical protein